MLIKITSIEKRMLLTAIVLLGFSSNSIAQSANPYIRIVNIIIDSTKLNRLEENLGTLNVELTTDDLSQIEEAAPKIKIEGARYPEGMERMTGL